MKIKVDFIERLEKLAKGKTAAARKAAEKESNRYRDSLDKVRDLSDKGSFADSIETLISRLEVSSDDVSFWGPRSPAHIREAFIQFCQVRKPIDFDSWKVVASPDESLPDERNLTTTHEQLICCSIDECESRARDILDFVWMFAKVARNVKSVFLPRVIQLMIDFDRIRGWHWWTTEENAARLIDELIACWRLVMKEVSLLDADEVADIWPRRPIHEDEGEYDDIDTDGMDAEEATEASRDQALEAYRREFKDLIPPEYEEDEITGEKVEPTHPMSRLVDNIKTLADEMERGEASADGRWRKFDYALLERVLSVNLELYYDSYEEGENGLDSGFCSETTRESAYKKQIVADLDRYLVAAIKLAKSCESKSQDDWAQCRSLESTYIGYFHGFSKKARIDAAKDLKVFITCLKRARQQLSTDRLNYTPPPKPKPGVETGISPVKIGKGFPFITYCDPKGNTLRMKVKRDNGTIDELTFKINGEERWHYVLQFVKAKTGRVTLTPFEDGKSIDLSLVFRDNKGYNHRMFYWYTRTTKGSKAKYWLEQTPLRKRTK